MASFWSGYPLSDFLVHGFSITTAPGLAGLCVSIVCISICYEGLRTLRDFVYRRFLNSKRSTLFAQSLPIPRSVRYNKNGKTNGEPGDEFEREVLSPSVPINGGGDAPVETRAQENDILMDEGEDAKCRQRLVQPSPYSETTSPIPVTNDSSPSLHQWMDLSLSSLLHMIYVTVSYTLMLAVMTWNVLILVSVAIGVGIGYYIFGSLRHNAEYAVFKPFNTTLNDPCQERLISSREESRATDSPSGSGNGGSRLTEVHCVNGEGGGEGNGLRSNEIVIGVQVHSSGQTST